MEASTASEIAAAADAATRLRPFLEGAWAAHRAASPVPADPFKPVSHRMCGFTSAFMAEILEGECPAGWRVAGGAPANGGVVLPCGRMEGHFWTVSDSGVVVDLTADQFGLPVIVVRLRDGRYRESFDHAEIMDHMPRIAGPASAWAAAVRAAGLAAGPRILDTFSRAA